MDMSIDMGCHLKTNRVLYEHHGVYIGDGLVIHYEDSGITIDTLDEFSQGFDVDVVPHPESPFAGQEIRSRAISRLGEAEYDLVFNNCEHFANWCCTGNEKSEQVNTVCAALMQILQNIIVSI